MVSKEKATYIATKELRFEIGNIPYLSDPQYEDGKGYVFLIKYTKPKLPTRDEIEDPEIDQQVEFYETQTIGEIIVTDSGEINRTTDDELQDEIESVNKQIEDGKISLMSQTGDS